MSFKHDCKKTGECYLIKHTPDWKFLDNAFSGKIEVGDIDGVVEANGKLLILEWKAMNAKMLTEEKDSGQTIMFKNITKVSEIVVYVIFGDPEKTIAQRVRVFRNGIISYEADCNNDRLFNSCVAWEKEARST